jgi:DNA-binding SARP family transcriptional activator/tetratricopeptide (TPR) repeat protein
MGGSYHSRLKIVSRIGAWRHLVLKLRLLGNVSLESSSGSFPGPATQSRQLALLALLAMADDAGLSRDKIQASLWPESSKESARHSLSDALYRLRRAMGKDCILAQGESLRLNPHVVSVDVHDFQEALRRRDLSDAAEAYRGPFMDGFHLSGSAGFEDWREEEARSLRWSFETVLEELAKEAEGRGRNEEAAGYWARLSTHDPLNTRFRIGWMRTLAASGDPGNALQIGEEHVRRLKEELGAESPPELRAAMDRLRGGESAHPHPRPQHAVAEGPTGLPFEDEGLTHRPVTRQAFVGRHAELERLRGFLDRALQGEGGVVFVTGEAGTGKTALASEFSREAAEDVPGLGVVAGNGNAHTSSGDPYLPFREVLGLLTGDVQHRFAGGSLSREHALRLWGMIPISVGALLEVGPDLIDTFVDRGRLQTRVSTWERHAQPFSRSLSKRLECLRGRWQQPIQAALHHQFARTVLSVARARPLLLVLDDIQWADSGSIELLFHLGRQLDGGRVLILGLYRPSEVAAGRNGARHPLEPVVNELRRTFGDLEIRLGETGERALMEALLDMEPNALGREFRDTLFLQTQGHALFTVEAIRAMKDQGLLVKGARGQWTTQGPLSWERTPARVDAVIAERIGRLPKHLQRVLSVAAVDGELFCLEAVAAVLGRTPDESLWAMMDELESVHGLTQVHDVQRVGQSLRTLCRFRHILFQRFLYDRMAEGERVRIHRTLGEALESLHGEKRVDIAVQLARHFMEAGLPEKALLYQEMSGLRARDVGAFRAAASHFEAALKTVANLPPGTERNQRELELWLELAWARTQGALGGQEEASSRAHELAARVGSREQRFWSVVQKYWTFAHYKGDNRLGRELTREALLLARESGDESLTAHGLMVMATNAQLRGDFPPALRAFEEVARVYDPARHRNERYAAAHDPGVLAIGDIGLTLWFLGYPDQARARCREALEMARAVPSGSTVLIAYLYLGWALLWRRDFREARTAFEAARQGAEEMGLISYFSHFADIYSGWCAAQEGEIATGVELLQRGMDRQREVGWRVWLSYGNALLADVLRVVGRPEEGLALWKEAFGTVQDMEELQHEAELLRIKGDLLMALPEPQPVEAEKAFREAIRVARRQDARSYELRATTCLARLLRSLGRGSDGQLMLRRVFDWFTEGFDTLDLVEAKTLLTELEGG